MSINNKIYSHRKIDNTHVHLDTNNSISTSSNRWQYTLTAYHKHVTMLGAKQYLPIESPNKKTQKRSDYNKWPWNVQAKQLDH